MRTLTGFTANSLPLSAHASTGAVSIGFPITFGGTEYSQLYVNDNGTVSLTGPLAAASPFDVTSNTTPIIAPFFADVDTRLTSPVTYGSDLVNGHQAFGVDWVNVGYYNQHSAPTDSFQLVLISRPDLGGGAFQIEFNYDHIGWESGDASGGSSGLGGLSAEAGYGSGFSPIRQAYQIIGSRVPGSFLDSNPYMGLVHQSLNSGGVLGRDDFTILPPVAVTTPGNQSNSEGATISLQIAASDSTGASLTYAANGLPNRLSIDPNTGLIAGQVGAGGSYQTTVTASDGTYTDQQTFTWTVSSPITITNPGTQTNSEGDAVSLQVHATDTNSGTLAYSASGLAPGLTMNASTGLISGTVAVGAGASAPFTTTVTVTDGTYTANQIFTWNVSSPVTITQPSDQTNNEGAVVSLPIQASNPSHSALTYAATGLTPGLSINPSTGLISGTIAAGAANGGPFITTVTASDGTYTAAQTFTWNINDPVSVTALADQTNTEGDTTLSLQVTASDYLGRTLSYSASDLPDGLVLNPFTGVISGTVQAGATADGPFLTTVTANDGTDSASQVFLWNINPLIVVSSVSDQTNNEGDSVSLQVHATDPTSGTLTFSAANLPNGLSINAATGLITGSISAGASANGPFVTTVTAADSIYSGSQSFNWNVGSPVAVTAISDQNNNEGDTVSLPVHANDATSGTLSYSASGLPNGLTINAATGVIAGTIGVGAAAIGPFATTVYASDGTYSASQTFNWNIASPVVVTGVTDQSNNEGDVISLLIHATDATNGSLSFTAVGLPSGLTINASSGLISGTVAAGGSYQTTVTAGDGTYHGTQSFNWNISSIGAVSIVPPGDQSDNEGDSVAMPTVALDTNSGTLTYSATGLPTGLSINASSGFISGNVSVGASANGPFVTTITATDGTATDRQSLIWNVSPVGPLTVTSPGDQTNNSGDAVTVHLVANDVGGGIISYAVAGLPSGLSLNTNTGIISGTVGPGGSYLVVVQANDGTNTDSQAFNWTVYSPVTVPSIADQSNLDSDTVSFQVQASDTESGTLTFTASGLPTGLSINATTGLISGTIGGAASAYGPFVTNVTVSDGTATALQTFNWAVASPVTVTSLEDQNNYVGDTVYLLVQASDTETGTLTYSASGLPTGFSINATTGLISGTLSATASTPFVVTVTATDGTSSGSAIFSWNARAASPLVVSSVSNQNTSEGAGVSLQVATTDTAGGTLTYEADGLPNGLSISLTTGLITGTVLPGASAKGPYVILVTATDGTNTDSQMFNWTVSSPVTVGTVNSQTNAEGDSISLQLHASDSIGRTVAFTASGLPYGLVLNPSTGVITGTISTGTAADGPFTTTIMATDGIYAGNQTFTWNVSSPITLAAVSDQSNNEGDTASLQLIATDSHGGSLTYSAVGLPFGTSINTTSGHIFGTLQVGAATTGAFVTTVTASDATFRASRSFVWNVSNPITLTNPGDQAGVEGTTVQLQMAAHDATNGTLRYSVYDPPSGLSINSITGALTWAIPTGAATNGPYHVAVMASDGIYSATQTFVWNIAAADDAAQADKGGGVFVKLSPDQPSKRVDSQGDRSSRNIYQGLMSRITDSYSVNQILGMGAGSAGLNVVDRWITLLRNQVNSIFNDMMAAGRVSSAKWSYDSVIALDQDLLFRANIVLNMEAISTTPQAGSAVPTKKFHFPGPVKPPALVTTILGLQQDILKAKAAGNQNALNAASAAYVKATSTPKQVQDIVNAFNEVQKQQWSSADGLPPTGWTLTLFKWSDVDQGAQSHPQFVMSPTADAFTAIQNLWNDEFGADCISGTQIAYWKALADTLGKKEFNRRFANSKIVIGYQALTGPPKTARGPWTEDPTNNKPALPGDWYNFPNLADYGNNHPDGLWFGESTVLTKLKAPIIGRPDAKLTSMADSMTVTGMGVDEQSGWQLIRDLLIQYSPKQKANIVPLILINRFPFYVKRDATIVANLKATDKGPNGDPDLKAAIQTVGLLGLTNTAGRSQSLTIDLGIGWIGTLLEPVTLTNPMNVPWTKNPVSSLDAQLMPSRLAMPNVNYGK